MIKSIVKTAGAGFLYYAGLLDAMKRPALTVLGYHRVLDGQLEYTNTSPLGMVVSPDMFQKQLAHAARRYRMVSLDEIQDACEGKKPLPPRAGFVTFDDGWSDNYTLAFPILRKMDIPAAVFVTTDYMGTQKSFWFTRLMQKILSDNGNGLPPRVAASWGWPEDLAGELNRLVAQSKPLRPWHLDPLIEMMKRYPETEIEKMVAAMDSKVKSSGPQASPKNFFLSWDELREMDKGGFRVGSHTCGHRILTQISNAEAQDELRRSKEKIEQELDHPVSSFAFPNGDYEPHHMQMAWDVGYRTFFVSSRPRSGGPQGRVFPRPCVHEGASWGIGRRFSPSLFEFHLAGVADRIRDIMAH